MATRAILLSLLGSLLGTAAAHPSMSSMLPQLLSARQGASDPALIGDLATLSDDKLTSTGRSIRGLLLGQGNPQDLTSVYVAPGPVGSAACARDTCCVWSYIASDLASAMRGQSGRCNNFARGAVRLGFHDAGTWSASTGAEGGAGGATGSIILTSECEDRADNNGLEETCASMRQYYEKYKRYGISAADLIQTAANVGTVVCPLGPRVRTWVGRKDVAAPSPEGLLPGAFDDADKLLTLFADKTISPDHLVALVGAHTTSQQRFVNVSRAGIPQDSTPGVWDVKFYGETLDANPPQNVFRFPSDENLAHDSRTTGTWSSFTQANNGQAPWNTAYASAYIRLSLLGVFNINSLTECTKVLPLRVPIFISPDESLLAALIKGIIGTTPESLNKLLAKLLDGSILTL